MPENIVLLLFLVLPAILFVVAGEVIRRAKRTGKERSIAALAAGNLLVLLLLLSVAMLVGECYYRFFYDRTDSFGLCKTTQRWFERHYQRNLTGFRDSVNYLPMVEPGKRRISFVGDSFTAGHGIDDVEDRFSNRVRHKHPEWEVHVLSECGWDTGKEVELITFLPQSGYETDVVVLVYCLNDISDITPQWSEILDRIYDAPQPGFFARNSYLFNTLNARRQMSQEPEITDYYGFIREAYDGTVWEQQQARLREFHTAVTSAGGSLMVVTFPFLHALGEDYPYRAIHEQLDQFWSSEDVPHLDLLDVLEDKPPDELILSPRDVHPNEHAHAIAAEAIGEFIDQQLVDRPD